MARREPDGGFTGAARARRMLAMPGHDCSFIVVGLGRGIRRWRSASSLTVIGITTASLLATSTAWAAPPSKARQAQTATSTAATATDSATGMATGMATGSAPSTTPPPVANQPASPGSLAPDPATAPGTTFSPATSVATPDTAISPEAVNLDLSVSPPAMAQPPPSEAPIFERWWFWTAIAAVAVTAVVIVATSSGPSAPHSDLGNMVAF